MHSGNLLAIAAKMDFERLSHDSKLAIVARIGFSTKTDNMCGVNSSFPQQPTFEVMQIVRKSG
jgi:hypothetical protein